jgi:hypothetical protein
VLAEEAAGVENSVPERAEAIEAGARLDGVERFVE